MPKLDELLPDYSNGLHLVRAILIPDPIKDNRLGGAFSFEEMGKSSFLPRRKRPGEFLLKQLRLSATYDGEAAGFILHLAMSCF